MLSRRGFSTPSIQIPHANPAPQCSTAVLGTVLIELRLPSQPIEARRVLRLRMSDIRIGFSSDRSSAGPVTVGRRHAASALGALGAETVQAMSGFLMATGTGVVDGQGWERGIRGSVAEACGCGWRRHGGRDRGAGERIAKGRVGCWRDAVCGAVGRGLVDLVAETGVSC